MGYNTHTWDKVAHYKNKTMKQLQDELEKFEKYNSESEGKNFPLFTEHAAYLKLLIAERIVNNMEIIVYIIEESGVDGRAPATIKFASQIELVRDEKFESYGKNKGYYSKRDIIVNEEVQMKQTTSKLNGLDKLMLGILQ